MTEALTAFDAIALTVIVLSTLMGLARGFVRELATLGAFIAALATAFYAHRYLRDPLSAQLPGTLPPWSADAVIILSAFLLVYVVIAWLGQRIARNIQGRDGVGLLDRLAGIAFGLARGGVAMVFFVFLIQLGIEEERIPQWIADGSTYPYFEDAAEYMNANIPRLAYNVSGNTPFDAERNP